MSRIVKIKNNSGSDGTWHGQSIIAGAYQTLSDGEMILWSADAAVISDVANGTLIVNKGTDTIDDILDYVAGLNWLQGNTGAKQSVDGDLKIVAENNAHVTGNKTINWTVEKYLDSDNEYSEVFVIPNNRTFTLNFLDGGSAEVATIMVLEWYNWDVNHFRRVNPDIRVDEFFQIQVDGDHLITDTVITIKNAHNLSEINDIVINLEYGFTDGTNYDSVKITAVDTVNSTITLESVLSFIPIDNVKIGLVDRVIGRKGNQISSSTLSWTSPPRFVGDGVSYLKMTMFNESDVDAGLVTALINGWHTATVDGD